MKVLKLIKMWANWQGSRRSRPGSDLNLSDWNARSAFSTPLRAAETVEVASAPRETPLPRGAVDPDHLCENDLWTLIPQNASVKESAKGVKETQLIRGFSKKAAFEDEAE